MERQLREWVAVKPDTGIWRYRQQIINKEAYLSVFVMWQWEILLLLLSAQSAYTTWYCEILKSLYTNTVRRRKKKLGHVSEYTHFFWKYYHSQNRPAIFNSHSQVLIPGLIIIMNYEGKVNSLHSTSLRIIVRRKRFQTLVMTWRAAHCLKHSLWAKKYPSRLQSKTVFGSVLWTETLFDQQSYCNRLAVESLEAHC